ncbi:MAG: hypothetical protein WCE81_03830 [Halobacteriota archaeon]
MKGRQQTYILATLNDKTTVTVGVGQSVPLGGVLSLRPQTSPYDTSNGIPNATVNIQSMNSDRKTWSTIATKLTWADDPQDHWGGYLAVKLTPIGCWSLYLPGNIRWR